MQWTGGKLARPVHSDSSLCPSIFRDKDPSFFLVKGRHRPHEGFMTCFMERSERSCCHFLNSFSLKYVLCLGAVFGSSMSWTPWAGNCTSWKAQRVAFFFSYFFFFFVLSGADRYFVHLWNQTFVPFSSWGEAVRMDKFIERVNGSERKP